MGRISVYFISVLEGVFSRHSINIFSLKILSTVEKFRKRRPWTGRRWLCMASWSMLVLTFIRTTLTLWLIPTEGKGPPGMFLFSFYLFFVALGLHCCTWAFSCCGKQGLLFSCSMQAQQFGHRGLFASRHVKSLNPCSLHWQVNS